MKISNLSEFCALPLLDKTLILPFIFRNLTFSSIHTMNLSTNKFLYFNCFSLLFSRSRCSSFYSFPTFWWWRKKIRISVSASNTWNRFAEYALNIVWKLGWRSRCYLDVQPKQIAHESLLIFGELYEVLLEIFLIYTWTTSLPFGFEADFTMTWNDLKYHYRVSKSLSRLFARVSNSLS